MGQLLTSLCGALVLTLSCQAAWSAEDWDTRARRFQQKHAADMQKREEEAEKALKQVRPIVTIAAESLNVRGDGIGDLFMTCRERLPMRRVQLPGGTLYYVAGTDFDSVIALLHFDSHYNDAARQKEIQEEILLMSQSPNPEHRKYYAELTARSRQPSTPAAEAQNFLNAYAQGLSGAQALTQAQITKITNAMAQRRQAAEQIARLLPAYQKDPADTVATQKIGQSFVQMLEAVRVTEDLNALFTPEQKTALGWDRPHRFTRSTSVSASAGGGRPSEQEMAKAQQAEEKLKAESKLKFVLKGSDCIANQLTLYINDGTLKMYCEPQADQNGGMFTIVLDPKNAWATDRVEWQKDAKGAELDALQKSRTRYVWFLRSKLNQITKVLGAMPPEVEARAEKMIAEMIAVDERLQKAYNEALSTPNEPSRQRALFDACRDAERTQRRIMSLCDRLEKDPEGKREDLPWLLDIDTAEQVARQTPTTYVSSTNSTTGESMSVRGRPQGGKQHVAISCSRMSLGSAAQEVEKQARRLYCNRKLRLNIDPGLAERMLEGVVEGTRPEELFKSLATRLNCNLLKDDKDPNAFVLKP